LEKEFYTVRKVFFEDYLDKKTKPYTQILKDFIGSFLFLLKFGFAQNYFRKKTLCFLREKIEKNWFSRFKKIWVSFQREKTKYFVSVVEIIQVLVKYLSFHCPYNLLVLEAL